MSVDYYRLWAGILARRDSLKLKHLNDDISYKYAAFLSKRCSLMDCHMEYLWAIVMSDVWCCVMFELSWRHPFTAEEQVCNAKFLQICSQSSVKETNIYILNGLRVSTFSSKFLFFS